VTGIGARGGFVVDLAWRKGRVIEAGVRSVGGTATELVHAGAVLPLHLAAGQSLLLRAGADGVLRQA
jgi:alpha-L-fucosidase 2